MSCTIFHDLNIFTAADPREGSGSQPVIIVLAKSTSESAGPQTARWSVSYLGPLAEFQQGYADRMSRLFSTGGARLARGRLSASDFFRYLNHQIDLAQPLSPYALHVRGIRAYGWNAEDGQRLGITGRTTALELPSGLHFGHPLDVTDDLLRLVSEALTLKEMARKDGQRTTTWVGRPVPIDRAAINRKAA
ncbi:hypothetical protein [Marinobacter subterrani]|uniref:hypothetical protein n=1 Tax=Marinobacter subterrani TaxID=1658765 RepID=UPI002353C2F2|nr:hypothetical protein [Marinobacter subterrani]